MIYPPVCVYVCVFTLHTVTLGVSFEVLSEKEVAGRESLCRCHVQLILN